MYYFLDRKLIIAFLCCRCIVVVLGEQVYGDSVCNGGVVPLEVGGGVVGRGVGRRFRRCGLFISLVWFHQVFICFCFSRK